MRVSKIWSHDENEIIITFKDFEINLKKIVDSRKKKEKALLNKEFKFIDIELHNTSDSSLFLNDLHLDSTTS